METKSFFSAPSKLDSSDRHGGRDILSTPIHDTRQNTPGLTNGPAIHWQPERLIPPQRMEVINSQRFKAQPLYEASVWKRYLSKSVLDEVEEN